MPDYTLFPSTTMGAVARKPQRLTIKGFESERLFVVKLDGGVKPNFQLMYAIGPGIFLNAFQQRMSLFQLEGLHILADCRDNIDNDEPAFFKFYKERNIVTSEKMITLAFNRITMTGYLVDLKIQNYNQDNVEGYIWNLQFLGWINNLLNAQGAGSGFTVAGASAALGSALTWNQTNPGSVLGGAHAAMSSTGVAVTSAQLRQFHSPLQGTFSG